MNTMTYTSFMQQNFDDNKLIRSNTWGLGNNEMLAAVHHFKACSQSKFRFNKGFVHLKHRHSPKTSDLQYEGY